MTDELTTWVDQVLGAHSVIERLPSNARKAGKGQRTRKVEDDLGRRWILKEVGVASEWRAEVHAYQEWVPAFAHRAPTLLAAHETLQVLLLSEVPGDHPRRVDTAVYRPAGALLRELHRARPPAAESPSDRDRAQLRLERLLGETRDVLTAHERSFVQSQADRVAGLHLAHTVPCHGDYRMHNWLLDASNTVRMIDFGKSRWHLPAWDFTKLFFRPWWRRPDLAAMFVEGYGRGLLAEEVEYIEGRMAVDAVSYAAFGVKRGSERLLRIGRSRLADLMAGHQVVTTQLRA